MGVYRTIGPLVKVGNDQKPVQSEPNSAREVTKMTNVLITIRTYGQTSEQLYSVASKLS